jgi:hypothetical protein
MIRTEGQQTVRSSRTRAALVALAAATFAVACGGGSDPAGEPATPK